ncbi:cis-muuroladiene synthase-like [Salvia splendens]|uniref:cis-muuroladiene synthase-like n=1 Tax=Salvia splendens TaxID=180675 RepID=UPI001C2608B6|nr:cis-muuroladiene synthase-like [Salvia splendens]
METYRIMAETSSCVRELRPPVTTHVPSIWGDTFSNYSSLDDQEREKYKEAIEELKKEARDMLMEKTTPLNQLKLIDTIERLGLAYLFETEIEHKLQQIKHNNNDLLHQSDLFTTALGFRLLRQHRHHISCDVFNKFVNKDGMFEEGDVEGMLSLYEAAHVRFRDEKILQEAADFTRRYLKRNKAELKSGLKDRVKRALERPLHRDSSIFYARIFIPIYETDPSRNELLLKLAKFNFNFLQKLYRKELSQLSRWWKELDLKSKLAYARDRVVEAYVWGVGYHYEPEYSYVRIGLAKAVLVVGVMDDTYDNYATINEAQLFTHILERWNMDEVDRLPEYMKIVYHFMLSTCDDYESDALKLGQAFATPYFKETVQQLGRAYSQELKWVMGRQMPPFKDYVKNSEITSAIYSMFAFTIPGLKSVSQETIDWLKSEPKIAISSGLAGRYLDDIGSHERESKGGQMLTAVDCYMKQHGVTKQEALSKFAQLYEEEWMDLNREWVETAFVPTEIAIEFLNYARMIDATYSINSGDAYTDPQKGKSTVVALFIDPILI